MSLKQKTLAEQLRSEDRDFSKNLVLAKELVAKPTPNTHFSKAVSLK